MVVTVMALNPRQRRFVIEYLIDFNGTKAAIRSGYAEGSAHDTAYNLLSNSEIMNAIDEKISEKLEVAELSIDWVLRQWKQIAEADPNELIYTQLECCRYCYGINHAYQWTQFEYARAVDQAAAHRCNSKCAEPCELRLPPDGSGGFGYTPHKPPVENCPVCHGRGLERVCVTDTRKLKGSARRLYAGVKQTKDGIEIKMRDQDGALQNISKYFGMILEKREHSGPGGGPIPLKVSADDLTDEQLIQFIHQERARLAAASPAGEAVVS